MQTPCAAADSTFFYVQYVCECIVCTYIRMHYSYVSHILYLASYNDKVSVCRSVSVVPRSVIGFWFLALFRFAFRVSHFAEFCCVVSAQKCV